MENVVSKKALHNILKVASSAVIDMDVNTQKALAAMWKLCNEATAENIILANLSKCEEYILWNGDADVRYLIESGCYQDEVQNISEDELNCLVGEVTTRVKWSDVASAGIEAGNDIIARELEQVLEGWKKAVKEV